MNEGEGIQHSQAVARLIALLLEKGFTVEKDMKWNTEDPDRVTAYYPDVSALKALVIEVNGKVGHSSKRSYENEINQKKWFNRRGVNFFAYSPSELVGKGWVDSKGNRHRPHEDSELYADWGL